MSAKWRPIPGYDGYEVSSDGEVHSRWIVGGHHHRGRRLGDEWRLLRGWVSVQGYRKVTLVAGDASRTRPVHILVAEAFHGPRPTGLEVRHLNGVKLDCRAVNLQWGTQSQNVLDRVRHGEHHNAIKSHCKRGHPFTADNTYVPPSGRRICRACRTLREAESRERTAHVLHTRDSV